MLTAISLAPVIFFAVVVVVSAIIGLVRGLNKSVIRIMLLAVAAILTFLIAGPIAKAIAQSVTIGGMTLSQLLLANLQDSEAAAGFLAGSPALQELIMTLPALAAALVVFPVVFVILNFISWIVFLFVQKPLRKLIFKDNCQKEEEAAQPKGVRIGKRFAGMGVGILCGVLIFGMLTAPLFGVFTVLPASDAVDKALTAMVSPDGMTAEDVESIGAIYGITDNGLVKFYRYIGIAPAGRAFLNSVATVKTEGQKIRLLNELKALMAAAESLMDSGMLNVLMASDNPNELYGLLADKAFVDALMQNMFQSDLLRAAIPELMATAMESVASGMGVPANKDAVYDNMMDSIALAVQDADIDFASLAAYEQAHSIVYTYAGSSSSSSGSETPAMTEEEYEAEIQKLIDLTLAISKMLNNALSGSNVTFADSVADWIVKDVKTQAAENGQDAVNGYDAAGVQNALGSISPDDINAGDGDANTLLEQLSDKEKFETDMPTVETITESIRQTVQNAMSDDSKAQEAANTLSSVVSCFASAVSSAVDENGNLDFTKLDFQKIGEAVSALQNSELKDVGSSLLDIMVAGDLGSNSMVGDTLGAIKAGYESGQDISGAIGSTGALINMMNGESQEDKINSITDLINNLDDFTISLLPSIFTADTMASMGIPAAQMDAAYNVFETLLKELLKLQGAEDYDSEVSSILSLFNLATAGLDKFTKDDIVNLAGYAMASDAIYNTLNSISSSNPFGIEITNADSRAELVNTIEEGYAQSGKTPREKDIYTALAKLLGIDESVKLA